MIICILEITFRKDLDSTQTLFYWCSVAHSFVLNHFWVGKGDGYSIGKSAEKQGSYVVKMYQMIGHSSFIAVFGVVKRTCLLSWFSLFF